MTPGSAPKKSRAWIGVVVFLALAGCLAWYFREEFREAVVGTTRPTSGPAGTGRTGVGRGGRSGAGGAVPVGVVTARSGDLPVYLTGLGTVTPINTVTVKSRVDGAITGIRFVEGQEVQAGDVLVEIDARPFGVQLMQAKGMLERDQALLANSKLDLARFEKIGAGASGQELDTARSQVAQFQATVITDQASIESAQLQITYAKIVAPISGRVGLRLVDVGNMVHASDSTGLLVITQLSPIAVIFSIPQTQLQDVLAAMRGNPNAKLQVEAFDDGFQRLLATGELGALDNGVDVTTGTVRLKATFQNEDRTLFPSGFVNARLRVRTIRGAVLIPAAGRQIGPDGNFVYVVDPEKKVHVRKVTTGQTTNEVTEVLQGLAPGEIVVTDGVDKLVEGAEVVPRLAGASRSSSRPGDVGTSRGAGRPRRMGN